MRNQVKRYLVVFSVVLLLPLIAWAVTYTAYDYSGVLFGSTSGTATITEAFGIRSSDGRIVGGYCADADVGGVFAVTPGCSAPGNSPSHGYIRSPGGTTTRINYPLAFETEAAGLNDDGFVVGLFDLIPPVPANADLGKGFYCKLKADKTGCAPGSFVSISYPGSASTDLTAINTSGEQAGLYSLIAIPPFTDFGFLVFYDDFDVPTFCTVDVGDPGGNGFVLDAVDTNVLGLNDKMYAVGSYDDPGSGVTAFVVTDVTIPDMIAGVPQACGWNKLVTFVAPVAGVHQTELAGISNSGWAVGNYLDDTPGPDTSHAFKVKFDLTSGANAFDLSTFATIDFTPNLSGGDNAASSIQLKGGKIVGNFEHITAGPVVKERAWLRTP